MVARLADGLADVLADHGLEPLAMGVDQGDGGDGCAADKGGEAGDGGVCVFRVSVQDTVFVQDSGTFDFIIGTTGVHTSSRSVACRADQLKQTQVCQKSHSDNGITG